MIWGEADIINKVHNTCNALESSPNRALLRAPIPTPPHSPSTKNCLPWNQSLVPERLRMAGVGWIVEDYWNNGLPQRLRGKEPACKAGNTGEVDSIPGLGRSSRGGCGNPLQYSCLENPMDRRAWQATVHRLKKCQRDWSNRAHCINTARDEDLHEGESSRKTRKQVQILRTGQLVRWRREGGRAAREFGVPIRKKPRLGIPVRPSR